MTDTQTDRQAWRLYDRPGPEGRVGENMDDKDKDTFKRGCDQESSWKIKENRISQALA